MNMKGTLALRETIAGFNGRTLNRDMLLQQIGKMNVLAISGGRVSMHDHTMELPVSNGYLVTITLDPSDTYTVRRIFARGGKVWVKGEWTDVYSEQVGEVAYMASCFRDEVMV